MRKYIKQYITKYGSSSNLSNTELGWLFHLYDQLYFKKELTDMLANKNRKFLVGSNLRSNAKAGQHSYSDNTHTITINISMINNLFKNEETLKCNGLIVTDRLDALMNVFEHELIHMYLSLKGLSRKIKSGAGKMYYAPHGTLFQKTALKYFGHTDYRHCLTSGDVNSYLTKEQTKVGMSVRFSSKTKMIYGKVIKINPRNAKVLTESNNTYSVPYSMLSKADRKVQVKLSELSKNDFRMNQKVKFKHNQDIVEGVVVKLNPTRARIDTINGTYNVSYSLLI